MSAEGFLTMLTPLGADEGIGLWLSVSALTTLVTNTMSNGAAVAVLGPISLKLAVAADASPIILGFITAVSSAFAYLTVVGAGPLKVRCRFNGLDGHPCLTVSENIIYDIRGVSH